MFNNYYSNVNHNSSSYAIASVMDAGLLVEGNVFENVQQACWSASGYADSDPDGWWRATTRSPTPDRARSTAPWPPSRTATAPRVPAPSRHGGAGVGRL